MLHLVHPLAQRVDRVAGKHGDRLARDHLAGVDAVVHEVHRRCCGSRAGSQHVVERMRARETREEAPGAR